MQTPESTKAGADPKAVHAACHPGATNTRHRSPSHPSLRSPGDGDAKHDLTQLVAVLEAEAEEENRALDGIESRSATGETAALDDQLPIEEEHRDHPPILRWARRV